jgi:putative FmdB family regulatory protein
MPFYEYECTKCGNLSEVFQKVSDPPLKKCSECNGKMRKLISQSTFHLKGSGWYVTDYASKTGGNDGKNRQSESEKKETKTKSDTTEKKASSSEKKKTKKED